MCVRTVAVINREYRKRLWICLVLDLNSTYLNAFLIVIPNIVTKFQNVVIFENCVTLDLSPAHACRVERVKPQSLVLSDACRNGIYWYLINCES